MPMSQDAQKQSGWFNEHEWLRALFMLSDMQSWLSEMEKNLFMNQPSGRKKKLFRKSYYLTASSFAHIIERHYYKVPRHIGAAKFTITIPRILELLRTACEQPPTPLPGSSNFFRELHTGADIGFDRSGNNTPVITIITDPGGKIITAFPGLTGQQSSPSNYKPDSDSESATIPLLREDEPVYLTRTMRDMTTVRLLHLYLPAVLN
jgi:hypothetical protein